MCLKTDARAVEDRGALGTGQGSPGGTTGECFLDDGLELIAGAELVDIRCCLAKGGGRNAVEDCSAPSPVRGQIGVGIGGVGEPGSGSAVTGCACLEVRLSGYLGKGGVGVKAAAVLDPVRAGNRVGERGQRGEKALLLPLEKRFVLVQFEHC